MERDIEPQVGSKVSGVLHHDALGVFKDKLDLAPATCCRQHNDESGGDPTECSQIIEAGE